MINIESKIRDFKELNFHILNKHKYQGRYWSNTFHNYSIKKFSKSCDFEFNDNISLKNIEINNSINRTTSIKLEVDKENDLEYIKNNYKFSLTLFNIEDAKVNEYKDEKYLKKIYETLNGNKFDLTIDEIDSENNEINAIINFELNYKADIGVKLFVYDKSGYKGIKGKVLHTILNY